MKLFKRILLWMFLIQWLFVSSGAGILIQNARLGKCIQVSPHEAGKISLSDCKPGSTRFLWFWDGASKAIVSLKTGQCLTVRRPEELAAVQLEPCGANPHQAWVCNQKGHLILHQHGLHLSTQQGGQEVFLSGGKNKFRRWRTGTDEIICGTGVPGLRFEFDYPPVESAIPWEQAPQSKMITSPEMPVSPDVPTTTSATPTLETKAESSSILPSKEALSLEPEEEKPAPDKKEEGAGNQRKTAGAQHPGSRWKTVMLVVSPLAFILGLIILALNIHYNKKKKEMVSALKRGLDKSHRVTCKDRPAFSRATGATHKTQIVPSSPSPSLKHGEILIEWKDGTITPLFDRGSYPIC